MRAFIAIELPEDIRREIGRLTDRLPRVSGLTWVQSDRMHLTLRFLGDVTEAQSDAMRTALRDRVSGLSSPTLHVCGVGAFPTFLHPSVFWVGLSEDGDALSRAQDATEQSALAIGLPPEPKAFHPHITLARVRDRRAVAPVIERIEAERAFDAGSFQATAMVLFSSQLTPRGPLYTRIEEFAFT